MSRLSFGGDKPRPGSGSHPDSANSPRGGLRETPLRKYADHLYVDC